ncbi:MAG: hypothetical protein R3B84_16495 [Zavarzinella sp.]
MSELEGNHQNPQFVASILQVITESPEPLPFKKIKASLSKAVPKVDFGTAKKQGDYTEEDLRRALQEAVDGGRLFIHSDKEPLYSTTRPKTAREKLESDLKKKYAELPDEGTFSEKDLGKPSGKKATPEVVEAFQQIIVEMKQAEQLFEVGKGKYSKKAPPDPVELLQNKVKDLIAALADDAVVGEAKLGKPGAKATEAEEAAFPDILQKYLDEKVLFAVGKGKYSKTAPKVPEWYEEKKVAGALKKIEESIKKLSSDCGVNLESVLAKLAESLGGSPPAVKAPQEKPKATEPELSKATQPLPLEVPASPAEPAVPLRDLSTVLKEAYEELCRFWQFQSRRVELRRLYFQAQKEVPNLTVAEFHNELDKLDKAWKIELHVLNEVHEAKDKELAIEKDGYLFYYIIWK